MNIDYKKYTLAELYDVRENIDKNMFPERYQTLLAELKFREDNPENEPQPIKLSHKDKASIGRILMTYKVSKIKPTIIMIMFGCFTLSFLCVGFTASGPDPRATIAFSLVMYFFGAILFVFFLSSLITFLNCKHPLIFTSSGLFYEPLVEYFGVNFVPWEDVIEARTFKIILGGTNTEVIILDLREGDFSESIKFPWGHKRMFGNSINFSCDYIAGNIDVICGNINEVLDNHKKPVDA